MIFLLKKKTVKFVMTSKCSAHKNHLSFPLLFLDINECKSSDRCGPNTRCLDTIGSFTCPCLPGFGQQMGSQECSGKEVFDHQTATSKKIAIKEAHIHTSTILLSV